MTIFLGSRYETAVVDTITDSAGNQNRVAFRGSTVLPNSPRLATQYVVHAGDRLDILARLFYGREDLWWVIADANDDVLALGDPLTPGTVLRIPDARYVR